MQNVRPDTQGSQGVMALEVSGLLCGLGEKFEPQKTDGSCR